MTIDQILIIAYFAIILAVGFYQKQSTNINFLYSGRRLTLPAFIATLVSTWYGGILALGRESYISGISTWLIFGLPYYIAAFIYARYILKHINLSKEDSIPSKFYRHYGKYPALLAVLLIFLLASPAPYLKMLAVMLGHILDIETASALVIGAVCSIAYTLRGGFKAVIKTDLIQFILMFSGFGYMAIYLCFEYGTYEYLSSLENSKLSFPGTLGWTTVFTWFFIALITFVDPNFYQRVYSAKNKNTAKQGIYISIGFWFLFDVLAITIGLYAAAILPEITNKVDNGILHPYLELVEHLVENKAFSPIIAGIFIISMLSIIMSTIDSFIFASGFTIGKDFMKIFKNDDNSISYTRLGIIVSGLFSIILAHFFKSAIDIWFTIGSFAVPGLLIPLLFIYFNINLKYPFSSMAIPTLIALLWFIYGVNICNGNYPYGIQPMYPGIIASATLCYLNKEAIS